MNKKFTILLTLLAFASVMFVACEKENNNPLGPNEIGGNTDFLHTKPGAEFKVQLFVDGKEFKAIDYSSKITKNNGGKIEAKTVIEFNETQFKDFATEIGIDQLSKEIKLQVLEQLKNSFGFKFDTTNKNKMLFEWDIKGKVTSDGVQDYIASRGDESKPFTAIKFDANVGDKYEFTTADGAKHSRTVIHIDNEPSYDLDGKKVKIYKTEQVSDRANPVVFRKALIYTCKEYGLVQVDVTLISGKVITLRITPSGIIIDASDDSYQITLTTAQKAGDILEIEVNENIGYGGQPPIIWADINNNGKKDAGEVFEDNNRTKKCLLTSSTLTIYGKVQQLNCENQEITNIDLSKNNLVSYLRCGRNQLMALDISKNPEMDFLSCHNNQISTLDLSKNSKLDFLVCNDNQLKSLDLSKNTLLTLIYCQDNQLQGLDLSKIINLETLDCTNNHIKSLNLSRINVSQGYVKVHSNPINGAEMTKLVESLPKLSSGADRYLSLVNTNNPDNWATKADVKIATDKGWKVYDHKNNTYGGK